MAGSNDTQRREQGPPPRRTPTAPESLVEAAEYERGVAEAAAQIRSDAKELTPDLFMELRPLLLMPIPSGYIETITAGVGKPYSSTGVRSVQVQHGRMNNVLTPMWWHEKVEYHDEGKLCHVTVSVDASSPEFQRGVLSYMTREAWGGVNHANTTGNLYKGSYTNAAKLAFARIGPGHEVYVGVADLDPDVSEVAAKAQIRPDALPALETVSANDAAKLRDHFDAAGIKPDALKMKLGAMGVAGVSSVNGALAKLTPAQAAELDAWMVGQGVAE